MKVVAGSDPSGQPPMLLFCENETNVPKLFGAGASTPYPKDGVNDHVVNGAATVNPDRRGTKMACWYRVAVGAGRPSSSGFDWPATLRAKPWISATPSSKAS